MNKSTPGFSLDVEGVKGICPAGEQYASRNLTEGKIPVLSCEGPCIRGEIARVAANMIAKEEPYARCCHAEVFVVPHSAMALWAKKAEKVVIIDGCFLRCHGRILKKIVGQDKLIQFDALSFYRKYSNLFDIDSVPEAERKEVARQVADRILAELKNESGKNRRD